MAALPAMLGIRLLQQSRNQPVHFKHALLSLEDQVVRNGVRRPNVDLSVPVTNGKNAECEQLSLQIVL